MIDNDFESYFYPSASANSYIQFDFKEKKVSLSKYVLESKGIFCDKLINWEIVGSNDCKNWILIDEQHINVWEGIYNISTYSTNNQEFYRYFRIRLKGSNSNCHYTLLLTSIEFFGQLIK